MKLILALILCITVVASAATNKKMADCIVEKKCVEKMFTNLTDPQ